jgi:hypothetical protein
MEIRSVRETFRIDLNSVDDGNRVVSLVGFLRPQVVPIPGEMASVEDEDGAFYDAVVESVLSDTRVYLRLNWKSKRAGTPPLAGRHMLPRWTFTIPSEGMDITQSVAQ